MSTNLAPSTCGGSAPASVDSFPAKGDLPGPGFSPQAFYRWWAQPVSGRDWSEGHLVDAVRDIHPDDPAFGYRFIADALEDEHAISARENRVARVCSAHGLERSAQAWGRGKI